MVSPAAAIFMAVSRSNSRPFVEHELGEADRDGRPGGDAFSHGEGGSLQFLIVHQAVEETQAVGFVGLQKIAGEQQFRGASQAAQGAGIEPGAAETGEQTDADVGGHEARARSADADIASASEVQAGAGGNAVDHGDHGFFATLHPEDQPLGRPETAPHLVGVAGGPARAAPVRRSAQVVQVTASAESPPGRR